MILPSTWYAVKRLKWLRRAPLLSPFNRTRAAANRRWGRYWLQRERAGVEWSVYLLCKLRGGVE